jgi:hypothetical protein
MESIGTCSLRLFPAVATECHITVSALLKKKVFIIHDKLHLHDSGVLDITHTDRQMIWKNGASQ